MDKSDDKTLNPLNRSFSFSGSPVSQKISIEQLFKTKDGNFTFTKFEQYYGQRPKIGTTKQFSHSSNVNELKQITFDTLDSSFSKSKYFLKPKSDFKQFPLDDFFKFNFTKLSPEKFQQKSSNRKLTILPECVPMDIDKSFEKENSMSDVHNTEGFQEMSETPEIKVPKLARLKNKMKFEKKTTKLSQPLTEHKFKLLSKIAIVLLIPILLAVLISTNMPTQQVDFQNENITVELKELLYGQDEFINKFRETLSAAKDKEVLVFIGGIGVGKTYSSHIISHNHPWNVIIINIRDFISNLLEEHKISLQLVKNKYNLVIIDSLEPSEASAVAVFIKFLLQNDNKMFIIPIFSAPIYSFDLFKQIDLNSLSSEISGVFDKADFSHRLFIFKDLDVESVKKCIRYWLGKRQIDVTESAVSEVLENVNFRYSGCKGVHSKVNLLN